MAEKLQSTGKGQEQEASHQDSVPRTNEGREGGREGRDGEREREGGSEGESWCRVYIGPASMTSCEERMYTGTNTESKPSILDIS